MGLEDYQALLKEISEQEAELQFTSFDSEMALELGLALVREGRKQPRPIAIDITRNGLQLFHFAMEGTAVDNGEWIKRKNNVVNRFGHSSFYVGTSLKNQGKTMEEKYLISSFDYAAHGGGFPIIIKGVGVVGTITVSGLHQEEDHAVVVSTLRAFLKDGQSRAKQT
jgi:uncharacterized protein (UPF0303 family)